MRKQPIPPLIDFFKGIKDPRVDRHKKYMLRGRIKQFAWSDEYLERQLFHSVFASEASGA
jgi:hypothetical protein